MVHSCAKAIQISIHKKGFATTSYSALYSSWCSKMIGNDLKQTKNQAISSFSGDVTKECSVTASILPATSIYKISVVIGQQL